ncbi:MAG: hypothetical protein ACFFBD_20880 [Candidatus Hodarchaeota archaeon]
MTENPNDVSEKLFHKKKDKPLSLDELDEYLSDSEKDNELGDINEYEKTDIENLETLNQEENLKAHDSVFDRLDDKDISNESVMEMESSTLDQSASSSQDDSFPLTQDSSLKDPDHSMEPPSSQGKPARSSTIRILEVYDQHWIEMPTPDKFPERYKVWLHWNKKSRNEKLPRFNNKK